MINLGTRDQNVKSNQSSMGMITDKFKLEAIGFPGFYESPLLSSDGVVDSIEDYFGFERDSLSAEEKDEIYASIDFKSYEEVISNVYMNSYIAFLNRVCPNLVKIDVNEKAELSSPSSYNYSSDHLYKEVSLDAKKIVAIHEYCLKDPEFEQYINDKFSDRLGFWSYYSNQKEDWANLKDLDSKQVNYLLYFYATIKSIQEKLGVLNDVCLMECLESEVDPLSYADDGVVDRISFSLKSSVFQAKDHKSEVKSIRISSPQNKKGRIL